MQLAQKEAQLAIANQLHIHDEQRLSMLHAELAQQHAELKSLQIELESAKERETAASVAADLDDLLDDPDQMPAEVHQLMSSLRRESPRQETDLPAQLQKLQQQLQRKEAETQERDAAMQQLLRGADRIEVVQRDTLKQLAESQSEVIPALVSIAWLLCIGIRSLFSCLYRLHWQKMPCVLATQVVDMMTQRLSAVWCIGSSIEGRLARDRPTQGSDLSPPACSTRFMH